MDRIVLREGHPLRFRDLIISFEMLQSPDVHPVGPVAVELPEGTGDVIPPCGEDHAVTPDERQEQRHLVQTAHGCGLDQVYEFGRRGIDYGPLQRGGESPAMEVSEVVLEDPALQPAAMHQGIVHLREELHPGGDPPEGVHDPVELGIDPGIQPPVAFRHPPHDVYRGEIEIDDAVAGCLLGYPARICTDPPHPGEHLRDAVNVAVVADEVQDHQPLLAVEASQPPSELLGEDRL